MTRCACLPIVALLACHPPPPARAGLAGVLHDATGAPFANVTVWCSNAQLRRSTKTDRDGRFAFDVPPGQYVIRPDQGDTFDSVGLAIAPGQRVDGLVLRLAPGVFQF